MWKGTLLFSLRDKNDIYKSIRLKLPRRCVILINSCYLTDYDWSEEFDKGPTFKLSYYLDLAGQDEAKKCIEEKLVYTRNTLLYFLGINDFNIEFTFAQDDNVPSISLTNNNSNIKKINNNFEKIINFNQSEEKLFGRCVELVDKAGYFWTRQLHEESLLQSFKIIELLSNIYFQKEHGQDLVANLKQVIMKDIEKKYEGFFQEHIGAPTNQKIKETTNKLVKELETPFSQYNKILFMLKKLNLNKKYDSCTISKIKSIRDRVASHGNLYTSEDISMSMIYDYSTEAYFLSREVVAFYFFNIPFKNLLIKTQIIYDENVRFIEK